MNAVVERENNQRTKMWSFKSGRPLKFPEVYFLRPVTRAITKPTIPSLFHRKMKRKVIGKQEKHFRPLSTIFL